MHPVIKILFGALMVVVGVYSTIVNAEQLRYIIEGAIGPLLVLIGAFIVWLESDEWKMRRSDRSSGSDIQQQFQPAAEKVKQKVDSDEEEEETENDKHACPDCGKEFDTQRGMRIHRAQKHE